MVLGLAIGYFVFWFRKVRLGKALQPLLGSMLIPLVTLLVFGVLTYYVIGPVMSDLMGGLLHFLNTIPPSMKFAAAFLVGAMLAFDMAAPSIKPPGSSASHCWKNTFMTGTPSSALSR